MNYFGFLFGGTVSFFALIGAAVAIGYNPAKPDWTGSAVSLVLSILGAILAYLCYKDEFGNKPE